MDVRCEWNFRKLRWSKEETKIVTVLSRSSIFYFVKNACPSTLFSEGTRRIRRSRFEYRVVRCYLEEKEKRNRRSRLCHFPCEIRREKEIAVSRSEEWKKIKEKETRHEGPSNSPSILNIAINPLLLLLSLLLPLLLLSLLLLLLLLVYND